jgi:hypothetical protein
MQQENHATAQKAHSCAVSFACEIAGRNCVFSTTAVGTADPLANRQQALPAAHCAARMLDKGGGFVYNENIWIYVRIHEINSGKISKSR